MDVLVPDDPVFHARFQSLEEAFLRRLHRFQGAEGPEPEDERMLLDAYDSWTRILVELPHWSHRPRRTGTTPEARRTTTEIVPSGRSTYTLYGFGGDLLTSLYPIEVKPADLECLTACLDLLTTAWPEQVRLSPSAASPLDTPDVGPTTRPERPDLLADVLRHVVPVLQLRPPRRLLRSLRHVIPRGPVVSVTLSAAECVEYRRFCDQIATLLSAGDATACTGHRAR